MYSKWVVVPTTIVIVLNAFVYCPRSSGEEPVKTVYDFNNGANAIDYFLRRRIEERVLVPVAELTARFDAGSIVARLAELSEEVAEDHRVAVMDTMVEIVRTNSDRTLRQDTVEDILAQALVGNGQRSDLDFLLSFEGADFNERSRELLLDELSRVTRLKGHQDFDDRIIRWVGGAGIRESIPILKEIDETQQQYPYAEANPFYERSALLALARLGERDAIEEVLALVDNVADPERRAIHFQQLAYVRQPEVVEYLEKFLFSERVFESTSSDVLPVRESKRAARALEAMIEGFPKGTIEEQRAWMNARTYYTFKGASSNTRDAGGENIGNTFTEVETEAGAMPGDDARDDIVTPENASELPRDSAEANSTALSEGTDPEVSLDATGVDEAGAEPAGNGANADSPRSVILYSTILGVVAVLGAAIVYMRGGTKRRK